MCILYTCESLFNNNFSSIDLETFYYFVFFQYSFAQYVFKACLLDGIKNFPKLHLTKSTYLKKLKISSSFLQPLFLYVAQQATHSSTGPKKMEPAPEKYLSRFSHIQDKTRRYFAGIYLTYRSMIVFTVHFITFFLKYGRIFL